MAAHLLQRTYIVPGREKEVFVDVYVAWAPIHALGRHRTEAKKIAIVSHRVHRGV